MFPNRQVCSIPFIIVHLSRPFHKQTVYRDPLQKVHIAGSAECNTFPSKFEGKSQRQKVMSYDNTTACFLGTRLLAWRLYASPPFTGRDTQGDTASDAGMR